MPSFTITGTDRARGAIGIMEPFRFHCIAEDAEQARGLTYRLRGATRQDVHIVAAYETPGVADVRTFIEEAAEGTLAAATAATVARDTLHRLMEISARLNELDTRRCNEPCGEDVAREVRRLELQARTIAAHYGLTLSRNSDPRGSALKIATPRSRRFNGMGGEEDGWNI